MPAFIEQDGDPQLPPPYRFPGITITSFRLAADFDSLQQLCDRRLNIGTLSQRGFEFRPLIPYVDLEILSYPRMENSAPPYANHGFMTQNEIYFRFFVIKYISVAGMLFPLPEIACFFPFIFVDNPWSAIAGREVLGFPKGVARFDLPNANPYPIKVSTQVLTQYQPNTQLDWKQFVEIRSSTASSSSTLPSGVWPWGDILGLHPLLQEILDIAEVLTESLFSVVLLKQFGDPESPPNACYQAITQSKFTATEIRDARPLPPATITINPAASLPIASSFGFAGTTLHPIWQYRLECDMTYGHVRNIFVAR
jgi:hypothetical protein